MVKKVEEGTVTTYYCDFCGEDFGYNYGMAENHEMYDCSPKKAKHKNEISKAQEELNDGGRRYQNIYSTLKENKLDEAKTLVNEYKKDIDGLEKKAYRAGFDITNKNEMSGLSKKLKANVRILNMQLQNRTKAVQRERALDFGAAIRVWEELGEIDEAARVRKIMSEQGAVKVNQKVVHGDEISKTEIKDSVLNKSNVGTGEGEDKFTKLKELKEMFDSGFISKEEMEKIKMEIIS